MYKPFVKTRVIFDLEGMPEEWFTERVLLCVPRFAWMLSRTLLTGYGFRDVTFSTGYTTGGYFAPVASEMDTIEASISEYLAEDSLMCEDIADAINNLTIVVQQGQACDTSCGSGGSSGAGTTAPPPAEFHDDDPLIFPEGFPDRDAYDLAKCAAANAIIASMKEDLQFLLTADIVTLTATSLAVAFLTPIPFDDILVFVGFLVAIFLQAILATSAQNVIDYIDANAEALVCLLFRADTATEALDNLEDNFTGNLPSVEATLANFFITFEVVNSLFQKSTILQNSSATMDVDCENDCLECEPVTEIGVDNGDGDWDTEFFGAATDPPGQNVIKFSFLSGATGCVANNVLIVPTNINSTPGPGLQGYQLYDVNDALIYDNAAVPPSTNGVHLVVVQSNTVGAIQVSWTT